MAELPAASVDAIVTDPPYELSFMGKGWDSTGVAYQPETWAEREADYVAIAEARIAFWSEHVGRDAEELLRAYGESKREAEGHEIAGQLGLLG